jgi:hypothetical protein
MPELRLDGETYALSGSGSPNAPTTQFGIGEDGSTIDVAGADPYVDGDVGEVLISSGSCRRRNACRPKRHSWTSGRPAAEAGGTDGGELTAGN